MERDELFVSGVAIDCVCKNGYIIGTKDGIYAIHYDLILAYMPKDGRNQLFVRSDRMMTMSDLKTIRGFDPTLRKRGDKYTSERYEIISIPFNVRG